MVKRNESINHAFGEFGSALIRKEEDVPRFSREENRCLDYYDGCAGGSTAKSSQA